MNKKQILSALVFVFVSTALLGQVTTVKGIVKDKANGEVLSFSDVYFTGSTEGTSTDLDGYFELSTEDSSLTSLTASFLGYENTSISIEAGISQEVIIELSESSTSLTEVVVTESRKVKKDTAAIALFRRVVRHKEENRPSGFDSYYYEDYVKTEFDIYNVSQKLTERKIFKPIKFVFDHVDTLEDGTTLLPVLLKEKISDVYFRKSPKEKRKEILKAEQFSGVENIEINKLVEHAIPVLDAYDNTLIVADRGFVSPFSNAGLFKYKYFLTDSAWIDDVFCYKLEFTPARKADLAFTGFAWIDKESAAIKSFDAAMLDNRINMEYIHNFKLTQRFKRVKDGRWFKDYDQISANFNVTKKKEQLSIRVVQTATRHDIVINEVFEDIIFKGDNMEVAEKAYKRNAEYWEKQRPTTLTDSEAGIYTMVNDVKENKTFKTWSYIGKSFGTGWFQAGPIEFGRFFNTYSFNELEGNRYRFGFRNNKRWVEDKFRVEGYLAYGDKDKLWKYHLGGYVRLAPPTEKYHIIGGHYRYDWSDYNFRNPYMTHDHFLNSLTRRSPLDDLFLIREANLRHEKDWGYGLNTKSSATHKTIYEWPDSYQFNDGVDTTTTGSFDVFELSTKLTWGPGQVFLSSGAHRTAVDISAPVFDVEYLVGLQGVLGGDYNYHKVKLGYRQKMTSAIGRTYLEAEAGKYFGKIPYPLLNIPKGNQSFMYEKRLYNTMDDLEFVTDEWASASLTHKFDGLIMNAIPGVNRLKLRTMVMGKALYGNLSDDNQELLGATSDLSSLNGFYAEAGFGVGNIFKVGQLFFVWRLTQRDDPEATKFAVKFYISPSL